MSQSIRLDRGERQVQFQLENSSDRPIPVLLSVHERIQEKDGSEQTPET